MFPFLCLQNVIWLLFFLIQNRTFLSFLMLLMVRSSSWDWCHSKVHGLVKNGGKWVSKLCFLLQCLRWNRFSFALKTDHYYFPLPLIFKLDHEKHIKYFASSNRNIQNIYFLKGQQRSKAPEKWPDWSWRHPASITFRDVGPALVVQLLQLRFPLEDTAMPYLLPSASYWYTNN